MPIPRKRLIAKPVTKLPALLMVNPFAPAPAEVPFSSSRITALFLVVNVFALDPGCV